MDILRVYRKDGDETITATKDNCTFGFMNVDDLKKVFKDKGIKFNKTTSNHVFSRIEQMYGLKYQGKSESDENSLYFSRPIGLSIAGCLPSDGNEEIPF